MTPNEAAVAIKDCAYAFLCLVDRKPGEVLYGLNPTSGRADHCCQGQLGIEWSAPSVRTGGEEADSISGIAGGCDDTWRGSFRVTYASCFQSFSKHATGAAVTAEEQNAQWLGMIDLAWGMAAKLKCCGEDFGLGGLATVGFAVESVGLDPVSGECFGFHVDTTIDMGMCCPD